MLPEKLKRVIIENLQGIKPNKIILFGSYSDGVPNRDSDIDLLVVTNDEFIPLSYEEHMQIYLNVSRAIREIKNSIQSI